MHIIDKFIDYIFNHKPNIDKKLKNNWRCFAQIAKIDLLKIEELEVKIEQNDLTLKDLYKIVYYDIYNKEDIEELKLETFQNKIFYYYDYCKNEELKNLTYEFFNGLINGKNTN